MTDEFIVAACVPGDTHASGTLDEAEAILSAHPEVAEGDIHAAAILGNPELARDGGRARGRAAGWDALTYLYFSRYLRVRGSDGFVRAAEALLDAGADPNTGFFEPAHESGFDLRERAVRRCRRRAHHAGLTRLLLARGADPNAGGEVAYHAPDGFDNEAIVERGRLASEGLTTLLHRKLDWADLAACAGCSTTASIQTPSAGGAAGRCSTRAR